MKKLLIVTVCAALTACNAGVQLDDSQLPSSRPAVPCEQSQECLAHGANAPICAESFIGNPPVMMSTWDNGKTWLIGNCDSTANDEYQTPKQ